MPITSIPRFRETDDRYAKPARRRSVPFFVLVIIGLYIGFVSYALLADDILAPGVKTPAGTDSQLASVPTSDLPRTAP